MEFPFILFNIGGASICHLVGEAAGSSTSAWFEVWVLRMRSDISVCSGGTASALRVVRFGCRREQLLFPSCAVPGPATGQSFARSSLPGSMIPLDPPVEPRFILDCGANVGYTSAYLLTRFPTAFLIAIEPDPGNAEILRAIFCRKAAGRGY